MKYLLSLLSFLFVLTCTGQTPYPILDSLAIEQVLQGKREVRWNTDYHKDSLNRYQPAKAVRMIDVLRRAGRWYATDGDSLALVQYADTVYFQGVDGITVTVTPGQWDTITVSGAGITDTTFLEAGAGISVTGSGTEADPYIISNTGDLSSSNEIQTLTATGAGPTSYDLSLSLGGGNVTLLEGISINLTRSGNTITIENTAPHIGTDLTFSGSSSPVTLNSSTGTDVTFTAGTNISISATGTNLTINSTFVEVDGSTSNELQSYNHSGSTSYTNTLTLGGGSFTLQSAGAPLAISHSAGTVTFTVTEGDGSPTNEIQTLSATGAGPTSYDISLSLAGGSVTLLEGTNINLTRSGNTITIENTGAAALSGVQDQIAYFTSPTTIGTEAGSALNSFTWKPLTNRMGIKDSNPAADLTIAGVNAGNGSAGIRMYEESDPSEYWNIWVGGGGNYDGYLNFTRQNVFVMNMDQNGTQFFKGLLMNENNGSSVTGVYIRPIQHGNSYIEFERLAATPTDGVLRMAAWGHLHFVTGGNGNALNIDNSGQAGFNLANTSITRTVDINGEVRIRDLTTTTPTLLVSTDANGVLSNSLAFGTGISITAGTLTVADGSATNEIQTISATGAGPTSYDIALSLSGGSVTLLEGTNIDLTRSGNTITINNTFVEVDGSTSNELQTLANSSTSTTHVTTLSNSGGSTTFAEGPGVLLTTTGTTLNGTVTVEAIDISSTNEVQALSASGAGPTSYDIGLTLNGTVVTFAEGSNIDLTRSGNTITIAATAATNAYVNGGNSFGGVATIGLNDNFRWDFEQNNTVRGGINTNGSWYIGSTSLSTAQLNINTLGSTNVGQLIAGGGSLVGPEFYQATGSGSGSDATILRGTISMVSGNVQTVMNNTSTGGSNGGALFVASVSASAPTYDPFIKFSVLGATNPDWSIGIDNDDADVLKIHRFDRPSTNNGSGTFEMGYNASGVMGVTINKVGFLNAPNNHVLDVLGKVRGDFFTCNQPPSPIATYALGASAGTTGAAIDAANTLWWGNGGRIRFQAGTASLVSNSTIFTVTLDVNSKFVGEAAPLVTGRNSNGSSVQVHSTYVGSTGVLTAIVTGALSSGQFYEFNIGLSGY